jgi:hypothetical protein
VLLERAMKVYYKDRNSEKLIVYLITSVTEKRAVVISKHDIISKEYKIYFNREVGDGLCFYARGSSIYKRGSYSIETKELKRQYDRQQLEYRFLKIDVKTLTDKQLKSILLIVQGEKIG